MRDREIISVSQVNEYIKARMDHDELLSFLCVRGEISNYKLYPSGHHYFSLKDAGGSLRCVMFKGSAFRLRFKLSNGMRVLAFGRISVFPRDGAYQLYCEQLAPDGAGDLHAAFEQTKERLLREGLFEQAHKKPIPVYPKTIAIVTSSAGAAIHDMLQIINRRYPAVKVVLLPVRVQGREAPGEIADAIELANALQLADVIITGRGGGSMEDLWAFNDEELARMIYRSKIPVISAVGHEPDVTIADYVADKRAATPSNAAELVVPDRAELQIRLRDMHNRMQQALMQKVKSCTQRLDAARGSHLMRAPEKILEERRMLLDMRYRELCGRMDRICDEKRQCLARTAASLDALSPLKVLGRGYCVAKAGSDILRSATKKLIGARITVLLQKGSIEAEVTAVKQGGKNGKKRTEF